MHSCLLILGMHRSGTSCLAGSLQELGLYLGNVYEQNPHNKKGNRENQLVMDLNDAVLAHNDASWDKAPPLHKPLSWTTALVSQRDNLLAALTQAGVLNKHQLCGFKDPRTLLTLPFWQDGLGSNLQWIGTFRHPLRVAKSLNARSGMPLEQGVSLWLSYNERLLALCRNTVQPNLLCFDQPAEQYQYELNTIIKRNRLFDTVSTDCDFFEDALRSYQSVDGVELNDDVLQIYLSLYRIYQQQFQASR